MSEPTNGHQPPRHLDDITAFMPAIPSVPRHAAPDTQEHSAVRPPVPPVRPQERPTPTASHREPRVVSRQRQRPFWKRWLGIG